MYGSEIQSTPTEYDKCVMTEFLIVNDYLRFIVLYACIQAEKISFFLFALQQIQINDIFDWSQGDSYRSWKFSL